MNELPEKLEDRIVTCSTRDFLELNNMSPNDYFFQSLACTKDNTESAYSLAATRMKFIGAIAITDVRISETETSQEPYRYDHKTTLYGTAIVPRQRVTPDQGNRGRK